MRLRFHHSTTFSLLFLLFFMQATADDTTNQTSSTTLFATSTTTTTQRPSTSTSPPNLFTSTLESIRKFFFYQPVPKTPQKTTIPLTRTYSNLKLINKTDDEQKEESAKSLKITIPLEDELKCPTEREAKFELFPLVCNKNQDCEKPLGKNFRCCKLFGGQRCHEGLEVPLEDIEHEPLFGIPRKCPKEPLAESFWDVKKCSNDTDCDFPRICCPSGRKRYCMNSYTPPEELPVGRQLAYPVESFSQYFMCSPPPPPAFDKHPKKCNSSISCFPNICCLENGQKYCRPPKKNLLSALTSFSQRFNVGFIRDWTSNLVIP
ncbi:hypothetical protein PVAND_015824 [Polypedilum vanderplanki]|uniref:WAP domain-containing protein n=1 Tax=Polypedilum vanderplanki TaxID=319348 RepID=A0A9J6BE07_POLVA|nr:hypothetical protein PVAND_015824 [Polypedilum vanderplanki]